jgi:hypothetical protein
VEDVDGSLVVAAKQILEAEAGSILLAVDEANAGRKTMLFLHIDDEYIHNTGSHRIHYCVALDGSNRHRGRDDVEEEVDVIVHVVALYRQPRFGGTFWFICRVGNSWWVCVIESCEGIG